MPEQIFLCHASEDKARVNEVYRRLKEMGFKPWMDKHDLLPGQKWGVEIPKAIKASDFVLVFLSQRSVEKRGYVQTEFKLALEVLREIPTGKIFIIPVRLEECVVPEEFRDLHCADLFEQDGFEKILGSINTQAREGSAAHLGAYPGFEMGPTTHYVTTSLRKMVHYGAAELVGEITITKGSFPANTPQRTTSGMLRIFYDGLITNSFAGVKHINASTRSIEDENGITIDFSEEYVATSNSNQIRASVTNTSLTGHIAIEIPPGIYLGNDGPAIRISGVRLDCSAKAIGTLVHAHVASDAMSFMNPALGAVGEVNESLTVKIRNSGGSGAPTMRLIEGFAGAFVQYAGSTLNPRCRFGATANTWIDIVLSPLPAGVVLTWPESVRSTEGTGTLKIIALLAESPTSALYEFTTPDQSKSDSSVEVFDITPTVSFHPPASPGTVFAQVRLGPNNAPTTGSVAPRFNHPFVNSPADVFFVVPDA